MELYKATYTIMVTKDLHDRITAKNLAKLMSVALPLCKGGGNNEKAQGGYWDTKDHFFFQLFWNCEDLSNSIMGGLFSIDMNDTLFNDQNIEATCEFVKYFIKVKLGIDYNQFERIYHEQFKKI